jgi:hypothetical protein
MKNIVIFFCTLISTFSWGQSFTVIPNNSTINNYLKRPTGSGIIHTSTLGNVIFETKVSSTSAVFQTRTFDPLSFFLGAERMQIEVGGDVNIGDFVKFGSDAPKINIKEFYINTSSLAGGDVSFTHGLNASQIISMKAIVDLGPAGNVPEEYTYTSGYQISLSFENTLIYVWNKPGNSNNILNKPCRILVTYGIN